MSAFPILFFCKQYSVTFVHSSEKAQVQRLHGPREAMTPCSSSREKKEQIWGNRSGRTNNTTSRGGKSFRSLNRPGNSLFSSEEFLLFTHTHQHHYTHTNPSITEHPHPHSSQWSPFVARFGKSSRDQACPTRREAETLQALKRLQMSQTLQTQI